MMVSLVVPLKWGKNDYKLTIDAATVTATSLMEQVQRLTAVHPANQKLLAKKGGWKGVLTTTTTIKIKPAKTTITLMGTATETIHATATAAAAPAITFDEDISPKARAELEHQENAQMLAEAEGNIPALQVLPTRRDDGKSMAYRYNYFVTGEPQQSIENLLRKQRESGHPARIQGEVQMTIGVELGKAMVTTVTVFRSGTLVNGRDDGKIQMWRHGDRVCEVCQDQYMNPPRPVTCSTVVDQGNVLVTGGSGVLKCWSDEGELQHVVRAPPGTDPHSLTSIGNGGFAVTFVQARPFDPNQFRLVPQNEDQRARRAAAVLERQRQQERFDRIATAVTVVVNHQPMTLAPWETRNGPPPSVTALAFMAVEQVLVVGDAEGSIRCWAQTQHGVFQPNKLLQLECTTTTETNEESGVAIIGLETIHSKQTTLLAMATALIRVAPGSSPGRLAGHQVNRFLPIPKAGVVVVLDVVQETILCHLDGHTDLVRVMCSLPNGELLTSGGKKDATCKLWNLTPFITKEVENEEAEQEDAAFLRALALSKGEEKEQKEQPPLDPPELGSNQVPTHRKIEPGYIFDACVLPDQKSGSSCYALGVARYNTVIVSL